ncbi:hypothetical protein NL676_012627 [Syzygium grande]|nr:hypothetical protein NL676_012627 [Syzygium grande]
MTPRGVSEGKYALGFVCTIGASAVYGLFLSLTQLYFRRVIRKETFRAILDMLVYQSLVASVIIVVGLLGSGEWENFGIEMYAYELGKVNYVMNLVGMAIAWQVFGISAIGLILDVSSLFLNSIKLVGLLIVPIFAIVIFGEGMDGVKVMAMILAIWEFVSYVYQQYLDDAQLKSHRNIVGGDEEGHKEGDFYVMNLVGMAIAWQVFGISAIGLILDVSSLFLNSIKLVGLLIVPIFAIVIFGEGMDGVKVMAMILAIWEFVSYVYQQYLDDAQLKSHRNIVGGDESSDTAARLHSTRVLGTFGYHALEYAMIGQITQKTDVYSFRVVFLEL